MIDLAHVLGYLLDLWRHHGAAHASIGAVSDHLGWLVSKHWIVRVCRVGSRGCHL